MTRHASELVRLLSEYRRAAIEEGALSTGVGDTGLPSPAPEEYEKQRGALPLSAGGLRAPKRPWEDVAGESDDDVYSLSVSAPVGRRKDGAGFGMDESVSMRVNSSGMTGTLGALGTGGKEMDRARSAAEKDMALIRSKRANNAAGITSGAPKGKYRKRSVSISFHVHYSACIDDGSIMEKRATPPGKCHSCNIRETPEWRRGPDGARTLCNACGLRKSRELYVFPLVHLD